MTCQPLYISRPNDTLVSLEVKYTIPTRFQLVKCILNNWNIHVGTNNFSIDKMQQKYLNNTEGWQFLRVVNNNNNNNNKCYHYHKRLTACFKFPIGISTTFLPTYRIQ